MSRPHALNQRFRSSLICLACLSIANGCVSWHPDEPVKGERAAATWRPRETIKGKFGLDQRARDIEQHVGVD